MKNLLPLYILSNRSHITLITYILVSVSVLSLIACKEKTPKEPNKPEIIHSKLGKIGKSLYISNGCINCHGAKGQSYNPSKFPILAGKPSQYLVQQLQNFKSYKRYNPMMNSVAVNLKDNDILTLSAYLSEL